MLNAQSRTKEMNFMTRVFISILTSFAALFAIHCPLVNGQSTAPQQKRPTLIVELSADKAVFKPKEDITLKVTVANDALQDDVFIYGELGFGYSASFTLFRRDAHGQEVPTRFIDDSRGNPPNLNDPNTFVRLSPGHFLGTSYESSIYNLNLEKPGKYRLWVEYHSPISKSEVKVAPFWGSEDGNVKSNVLEISVRP
jgi:hypothetical protein